MIRITHNRARCRKCGEIIESETTHDFKQCSCGSIFVDGGHDYIRRGYADEDLFEDLSECEDVGNGEVVAERQS